MSIGPSRPSRWRRSSRRSSVVEVEPVAGLRLDRRHAVAEHLVEPAPAVGEQFIGGRGARRGDRREDAAAGGQDLEVARAALAEHQLGLARAGEQQVRVRVDEARRDRPAAARRAGRTGPAEGRPPRAPPRPIAAARPRRCGPPRPRRRAPPARRARPPRPPSSARSPWARRAGRRRPGWRSRPRRRPAGRAWPSSDRPPLMTRNRPLTACAPRADPPARAAASRSSSAWSGEKSRRRRNAAAAARRRSIRASRGRAGMVRDGEERGQRRQPDQLRLGQLHAILGGEFADRLPDGHRRRGLKSSRFIETCARRSSTIQKPLAWTCGRPPPDSRDPAGDPLGEVHVLGLEVDVVGDQEGPRPDGRRPPPRGASARGPKSGSRPCWPISALRPSYWPRGRRRA